jgi:ribosomal protein L11 methyltransferase
MNWVRIRVFVEKSASEALFYFMQELSVNGTAEYECGKEKIIVEGFIPEKKFSPELISTLKKRLSTVFSQGLITERAKISVSTVKDDWSYKFRRFFKPRRIGNFLICAPWHRLKDNKEKLPLIILPGRAFGTGTHPTTQRCLKLLQARLGEGKFVIDVGTGSGILAIAAAKLGATRVIAIDIDPIAIKEAKDNLRLNKITSKITLVIGDVSSLARIEADLILANIEVKVINQILPQLSLLLKHKGWVILSGLLKEYLPGMISTMKRLKFEGIKIFKDKEWRTIEAMKGESE